MSLPSCWAQTQLYPTDQSWQRSLEWPWWLLALLAVAVAMWVALNWWTTHSRARRGWWLVLFVGRVTVLMLLLIASLGWYQRSVEIEPPEIVICVDVSQSMRQPEEQAKSLGMSAESRLDVVTMPLLDKTSLQAINDQWRVRWFVIGNELRELTQDPQASGTEFKAEDEQSRLGDGLSQLLDRTVGRPLAAILFLSDGVTTSGRELDQLDRRLQRRGVPVFGVAMGSDTPPQDVRVLPIQVPSQALVGETLIFRVPVVASQLAGQEVQVTMTDAEVQEELTSQVWTPTISQETTELEFVHRISKPGPLSFRFEASVDVADYDLTNNDQMVQVQATERQHRILIVANRPQYEYRFLKHTIERAIRQVGQSQLAPFQLNVFLQESQPEFSEIDAAAINVFPVSLTELSEYDVVVLIDPLTISQDRARGLSDQNLAHLTEYVEREAGNLVIVAGRQFDARRWSGTALERLLPARSEDFQTWDLLPGADPLFAIRRSPLGERSPALQLEDVASTRAFQWDGGLEVQQITAPTRLRPGTRVLLQTFDRRDVEGQGVSLLSLRTVGTGAVVFQGFAESYRLRFRRDDQILNAYWSQWMQYLAKRKWLSQQAWRDLRTDALRYRVGDEVSIRAVVAEHAFVEPGLEVTVWSSEGFETRLTLSTGDSSPLEYVGELRGLATGTYTIALDQGDDQLPLETRFEVVAQRSETDVVAVDREALKHLAEVTQGRLLKVEDLSDLTKWLPRGKPIIVGQRPDRQLWDRQQLAGLLGAILVLLLTLEWILRSRGG